MKFLSIATLLFALIVSGSARTPTKNSSTASAPGGLLGFRDSASESAIEARFLAVPDPKLAEQHLRTLTQAPHMAGTTEDKATADYVAQKFREAGLDTEIVEYKVWINYPSEISVDLTAPPESKCTAPLASMSMAIPFRTIPGWSCHSPACRLPATSKLTSVYANYGSPDDFDKLEKMKVDVRGKIVLVRYGQNFRGVKAFVAQERGAAGVIIYSDPADDGWRRGDKYPEGPWRPDTGVQRGSIGYMFEFPGDPTTPGIASVPSLPSSERIAPQVSAQMPKILVTPLSYHDAWPILQYLDGPESPREWQGSLPFTYHVGPGPARVKMHLKQDYEFRTLWDVIGNVQGTELPDEWVVAGNHRDAWVYGAVDPNSGTAAMLEAVHGIGELLRSGWKPKRTLVFGSWDGEEEGLMGSTEWVEQNERSSQISRLFQHGCGCLWPEIRRFGCALPEAVCTRRHQGGPQPEGWNGVRELGEGCPHSCPPSDAPSRTIVPPPPRPDRCPGRRSREVAPTTLPFSSTWECPQPMSARVDTTAFITRCSTTSPGSRNSATPILLMNNRWRASLACRWSEWPMRM